MGGGTAQRRVVEYVDRTYGNTMSYITGWFLALGNAILCPWEAIAISTLVSDMFGDLFPILRSIKLYSIMGADVYLLPTVIALSFAVYVIIQNFRGASAAASLQAFLTKALLCGMILAMGISLVKVVFQPSICISATPGIIRLSNSLSIRARSANLPFCESAT